MKRLFLVFAQRQFVLAFIVVLVLTAATSRSYGSDPATGTLKAFDWSAGVTPTLGTVTNAVMMPFTLPKGGGNVLAVTSGFCIFAAFTGFQFAEIAVSSSSASFSGVLFGNLAVVELTNAPGTTGQTFAAQRLFTGLPAGSHTLFTVIFTGGQASTCFGTSTVIFSPSLLP